MPADSQDRLARARVLLADPAPSEGLGRLLAAAALFAASALALAAAVAMMPSPWGR